MKRLLVVPSALALLLAAGAVSISGIGSEVQASPDKPRKVMNFTTRHDRDDSGGKYRSGYRDSHDDDRHGYRDDRDDDHDDRDDDHDGGYGGGAGGGHDSDDDDHGSSDDGSGGHSDDD